MKYQSYVWVFIAATIMTIGFYEILPLVGEEPEYVIVKMVAGTFVITLVLCGVVVGLAKAEEYKIRWTLAPLALEVFILTAVFIEIGSTIPVIGMVFLTYISTLSEETVLRKKEPKHTPVPASS